MFPLNSGSIEELNIHNLHVTVHVNIMFSLFKKKGGGEGFEGKQPNKICYLTRKITGQYLL